MVQLQSLKIWSRSIFFRLNQFRTPTALRVQIIRKANLLIKKIHNTEKPTASNFMSFPIMLPSPSSLDTSPISLCSTLSSHFGTQVKTTIQLHNTNLDQNSPDTTPRDGQRMSNIQDSQDDRPVNVSTLPLVFCILTMTATLSYMCSPTQRTYLYGTRPSTPLVVI